MTTLRLYPKSSNRQPGDRIQRRDNSQKGNTMTPNQDQGEDDGAKGQSDNADQGQDQAQDETRRDPYVGEIVMCLLPDGQLTNGSPEHPAIVTAVHSPTIVNLQVFLDANPVVALTSVAYTPAELSEVHTWRFI